MGTPFFITGLPRSRTAWLSVVAGMVPGSCCVHEPTEDLQHWTAVRDVWAAESCKYMGISDSSLAFRIGWVLQEIRPKTLIVLRHQREVEASIARLGWGAPGRALCNVLAAELHRYRSNPLVMTVAYDALDDCETVRTCLEWLMPDAPLHRLQIERLQRLRIEARPDRVLAAAMRDPDATMAALGHDFFQALAA